MNKREVGIICALLIVAGLIFYVPKSGKSQQVVRSLLGGSADLRIEKAQKLQGGREPVHRCMVLLDDNAQATRFLNNLGLHKVTEIKRQKSIQEFIKNAFDDEFQAVEHFEQTFYSGVLKAVPYAVDAIVKDDRIYMILSRY